MDASVTLDHRLLTSDGRDKIIEEQLGIVSNTFTATAGAVADGARVGAVLGSVFELSIEQSINSWNTVGQGQALAYHQGGELAGLVEGMRDGDIEDGFVLQDGLTAVDQFLNQTDDQRVLITEGAVNAEGNDVYGAAHENSNTMFVDIDGERMGSLVNTVAHEGMHLAGSGEVNATFTGLFTDIAYRANALVNKGNIDNHRPAPVAIQDQAAHQQLLSGNQVLFKELDDRGELEYLPVIPIAIGVLAYMASDIKTAVAPEMDVDPSTYPTSVSILPTDVAVQIAQEVSPDWADPLLDASALLLNPKRQSTAAGRGDVDATSSISGSSEYRGGPHSQTKQPVGDGLESHHLPADSVSPIPREQGPAIQMDPADHRATSSHGTQGADGFEYRAEVERLINDGRMRDAMALEVNDVRRAAREVSGDQTKYNEALQEMLDYSRDQGWLTK